MAGDSSSAYFRHTRGLSTRNCAVLERGSKKSCAASAASWGEARGHARNQRGSRRRNKMLEIRPSMERGHANHGWLDTRFTFSFDQYHDPKHMHFRSLRVLNEDVVAPGQGFGMHPHRDMEILTWILEGSLEHRDSMGTGAVIRPGELQHMSAGTGVMHSEFNPSKNETAHLLQIWLLPERQGLKPQYEQLAFPDKDLRGNFHFVAGPKGPVTIHQDANLHIARLDKGASA